MDNFREKKSETNTIPSNSKSPALQPHYIPNHEKHFDRIDAEREAHLISSRCLKKLLPRSD